MSFLALRLIDGTMKAMITGDGAIGKTLVLGLLTKSYEVDVEAPYEPTTFNNFTLEETTAAGGVMSLEVWDSAGQEAFESLRKLSYPGELLQVLHAPSS